MFPAREEEEDLVAEEEAIDNTAPMSPIGPIEIHTMEIEESAFNIYP